MNVILLKEATVAGPGPACRAGADRTFQATLQGSGAISAKVIIEISNDKIGWLPLGNELVINGNGPVIADGWPPVTGPRWTWHRANLTEITPGAKLTASMETN